MNSLSDSFAGIVNEYGNFTTRWIKFENDEEITIIVDVYKFMLKKTSPKKFSVNNSFLVKFFLSNQIKRNHSESVKINKK